MSAKELWAEAAKKYPVHEETIKSTENDLKAGMVPWNKLTLQGARDQLDSIFVKQQINSFDGSIQEINVPSPNVKDGIPITIYKSSQCPAVPVIWIYFHGGGLVIGSRKSHEDCVRLLAANLHVVMINVEYRLLPCPEDPLAPFNDAVTVTEWVMKNKTMVGACAQSKVGVGGDSAGGQITCSVTNDIQGLDFQILLYPVTDLFCNLPSFDEFRDTPFFNTEDMEAMFQWSGLPIPEVAKNPRVNPSARKNLESSPPTLMILAQLDPLRDWGVEYGKKLRAAGVNLKEVMTEGVPHGFFVNVHGYPTKSAKAREYVANFIQSIQ